MFGSNNATTSQALALYLLHQALEAVAKSPVRLVEWKLKNVNTIKMTEQGFEFRTIEIKANFWFGGDEGRGDCWATFRLHLVKDIRKGQWEPDPTNQFGHPFMYSSLGSWFFKWPGYDTRAVSSPVTISQPERN